MTLFKEPYPFAHNAVKPLHEMDTEIEFPIVTPLSSPSASIQQRLDPERESQEILTNPCPYWHAPQPKPSIDLRQINIEKIAGRMLFIGMALFTLLVTIILLWKVLLLVWVSK